MTPDDESGENIIPTLTWIVSPCVRCNVKRIQRDHSRTEFNNTIASTYTDDETNDVRNIVYIVISADVRVVQTRSV